MGTSLLTSSQKNDLNNVFNDMQATFGRPITIYQSATETVLVTNPDNNFLYQNAPTNSITSTVINSGVYLARILWGKREDLVPFAGGGLAQNQIRLKEGHARIKLDPTGASYIASAERIVFDENTMMIDTSPRPHGLFDPNFRTLYLKPLN
jgi:hypothetical protein